MTSGLPAKASTGFLNVHSKSLKLLVENFRIQFHDTVLDMKTNQATKVKTDGWHDIKL